MMVFEKIDGKKRGYTKYLRQCKRCDKIFRSHARKGKICRDCNRQGQVKPYERNKKKKKSKGKK